MHYTIDLLMHSTRPVPQYFTTAGAKWKELLADISSVSPGVLAKRLADNQRWFELNCGGRPVAQEIMAWSAFGSLYNIRTNFEQNMDDAEKLAKAFATSLCSPEVKGHAQNAAQSYGVAEPRANVVRVRHANHRPARPSALTSVAGTSASRRKQTTTGR